MLQVKIKDDTGNTIGQNIRRIRKSQNMGQTALVRNLQFPLRIHKGTDSVLSQIFPLGPVHSHA